MAATTIDELQVLITAQNKQFQKALREVSSQLDGVSGEAQKASTKMSAGFDQVKKVAKVAFAAVGAAAVAGVGMAIKSYANYEQLVGGVETLFKDSSKQVLEYANNAYKTAGLSANRYMEQATSFSATLLQGLGGDTEKAAKYADKAITDMSDNANKMGTDIGLIQNAYQGFAKDNYTMLDNLKLGYGGTATEMARLVNESGVMGKSFEATAENVKDIPFDQMIEAIHKTQQEMGITGTTAKEASETISGSWNAVKASFENVLTGIEGSGEALATTVLNLASQLSQKVPQIAGRLAAGLTEAVRTMLDKVDWQSIYSKIIPDEVIKGDMAGAGKQLGTAIGTGIAEAIKLLRIGMDTITGWFGSLNWGEIGKSVGAGALAFVGGLVVGLFSTESLSQFVGFIADNWVEILLMVIGIAFAPAKLLGAISKPFVAIISKIPFGPTFITAFGKLVTALRNFVEPIRAAFSAAVVTPITKGTTGLVTGVKSIITTIKDIMLNPFRLAVQYIADYIKMIPVAAKSAVDLVKTFFAPMTAWFGSLFSKIAGTVASWFGRFAGPAKSAWGGIKGAFSGVGGWFKGVFQGAWNNIKSIFSGMASWFSKIDLSGSGRAMISSLIGGIKSMLGSAKAAASDAVSAIRDFFPFSPAKEGPFSGKGYTTHSGKALMQDFAGAIQKQAPLLKNTMDNAMPSFSLPSASDLKGRLDLDFNTRLSDMGDKPMHVTFIMGDDKLVDKMVNGINNRSFMTNDVVINV